MRRVFLVITIAILFCQALAAEQCNNTHLEFLSEYSLGKQDELNKTFIKIQKDFPQIEPIHYLPKNGTHTYTISTIQPVLYYRDSKQKAQVIDNDTIIISGGTLQIHLQINWQKPQLKGTASVSGLSESIVIAKKVTIDKGFYVYTLIQAFNLSSYSEFRINRISPQSTSQQDIDAIHFMVNQLPDNKSLKQVFFHKINEVFAKTLNQSLHDQKYHPSEQFDYIYQKNGQKLVSNYTLKPTGVSVTKVGLVITYTSFLKDFSQWRCGNYSIPPGPLDVKEYGGMQEIISNTILENNIRYAAQNTFFDSVMNQNNWESRFFQFFAGDLYQVIPQISKQFAAMDAVSGICRAARAYDFKKSGIDTINVTLEYDCNLEIKNTRIIHMKMNLQLMVRGVAQSTQMQFTVADCTYRNLQIFQTEKFKVQNMELAEIMIKHSLNRLKHQRVFGTGWKLLTRDYPHFKVEDNYVVVYDSTHIKQEFQSD